MAPKKAKKKEAKADEASETVEDSLARFKKEYKARCDVATTIPLDSVLKMLADPEEAPKKIQWLVIMKERMSISNLEALISTAATLFPEVVSVRSICLWGCGVGDDGMEKVMPMLLKPGPAEYGSKPLPQQEIQRLDFVEDGLTAAACKHLAQAFRTSMFLRHVSLSYNPIGDGGIAALAEGLIDRGDLEGVLQVLDLEGCDIAAEGMGSLAKLLGNPRCVLNSLNLKGNHKAGQHAVGGLLSALKVSPTLTTLNLHDTFKKREAEHEEDFRSSLKDVLISHLTLSDLDLTGNAIGAEEGQILFAALQMNRNLTAIKVDRDLDEMFNQINVLSEENLVAKQKASKGKKKKKK